MTLSAVALGLSIPGAIIFGAPGVAAAAAVTLGGEIVIGRMIASAMASPGGRSAFLHLLKTKAGTAAATHAAIRLVTVAVQNTERNMEGGLPAPPQPQAIEVGPADLRQNTEIMLRAKEGEITPAEANQQIPRRQRAIKLLRPPPQE